MPFNYVDHVRANAADAQREFELSTRIEIKERHYELWFRNLFLSLSIWRLKTTNMSEAICVPLYFVIIHVREIVQYRMNVYQCSGNGCA